jgi:hypothetical protein
MPVKARIAKDRWPAFSAQAVELFRQLEATPLRMRKGDKFYERDLALHDLLGLGAERLCSVASVLDHRLPDANPQRPAGFDQAMVYQVRRQLIEAVADQADKKKAVRC